MHRNSLVRVAPWLLLLVAAYAAGRWGARDASPPGHERAGAVESPAAAPEAAEPPAAVEAAGDPATPAGKVAQIARLAEAARLLAEPDARTYAFFEGLQAADLEPVARFIGDMPAGNEQDALFTLLIRRWAQIDGPAAMAQAETFPALTTRTQARFAAYADWAAKDPAAALAFAQRETQENNRERAIVTVLMGAATADPRTALTLLQAMPAAFLESPAALVAARQIASGAYGTGKREAIQNLVGELREGDLRNALIDSLVREWGGHYPDETLTWLQKVTVPGEQREELVNGMFGSLAQKDPALAAAWAAVYPDSGRQPALIAAAVAEWAQWDVLGAETWINEQPGGAYLDAASYVIASHHLGTRDMHEAFAWIRRIGRDETRGEMLANLGRVWAKENPAGFKKFIDETSLNRAEVDLLFSQIEPPS